VGAVGAAETSEDFFLLFFGWADRWAESGCEVVGVWALVTQAGCGAEELVEGGGDWKEFSFDSSG